MTVDSRALFNQLSLDPSVLSLKNFKHMALSGEPPARAPRPEVPRPDGPLMDEDDVYNQLLLLDPPAYPQPAADPQPADPQPATDPQPADPQPADPRHETDARLIAERMYGRAMASTREAIPPEAHLASMQEQDLIDTPGDVGRALADQAQAFPPRILPPQAAVPLAPPFACTKSCKHRPGRYRVQSTRISSNGECARRLSCAMCAAEFHAGCVGVRAAVIDKPYYCCICREAIKERHGKGTER